MQRRRDLVYFVGHLFVCAVVLIVGAVFMGRWTEEHVFRLCVAFTGLTVWTLWSRRRTAGTLFDPYGLFMVSLILFGGGQALLETVGLNERGVLNSRFDAEATASALFLVLAGVAFVHLGALWACLRRAPKASEDSAVDVQSLRVVGWALLAVAIVPSSANLVEATRNVLSGGYMALYEGNASVGAMALPQLLAMFLTPAALLLLAGAERGRPERTVAVLVIAVHVSSQLFLGFRSSALMSLCAFLWLWHETQFRIKASRLLVAAVFVIGVVIPLSRQTRDLAGSDRASLTTLADAYRQLENPFAASFNEMGESLSTVAYTYVLVPSTRPFEAGASYAFATLTVFPNVFWDIHPTVARGLNSTWLIWTVDPGWAARGGGLGYSPIAEAYLNFGWLGVPAVMTLVGLALSTFVRWARTGKHAGRLALAAIVTAFVLRVPRDEVASTVRVLVWYSWLPYVAATFIAGLATRRIGARRRSPVPAMPAPGLSQR